MTPERWRRVRAVLEPALEMPVAEVDAWLDAHCEPELRDDVDVLIEAARDEQTLLDEPVVRADSVLDRGTAIGPYEIEELIGVGGMGVVYRARDPRLDRPVAIKLLTFGGRESDLLAEARAAGGLHHPHIVVVHDVLEVRDTPAIVMEFVEGRTLADVLDAGPLPANTAATFARQIAGAVDTAHAAGILHRDLKPANVIVRPDGTVKVLDFGIARRLEHAAHGTRPAGTAGYASPEQQAGAPLDARTDIYSFGAVLRDMFAGQDAESWAAVPRRWRHVLDGCLARDPADRYPDMETVAATLEAERRRQQQRPRRMAAALLVATIAALALLLSTRGRPDPPPSFSTTRLAAIDEIRAFPKLSPDGSGVVFSVGVDDRQYLFVQSVGAVTPEPLHQEGQHGAWSPDGTRIAFRSERDGGGLFVLRLDDERVRQLAAEGYLPAWSPDGSEIAFSTTGFDRAEERPTSISQLRVVSLATGAIRNLVDPSVLRDAIQPAWSPDGAHVAFWSIDAGRRSIWTVAAAGGTPTRVTATDALDWSPAWSPDGWLYWASDRSGTMNAWRVRIDSATGAPRGAAQPVPLPTNYAALFSFARSGTMAFSAQSPTSSIWKVPLDATAEPERLTPRTLQVLGPSLSPDGSRIVASEESPSDNLFTIASDGSDFRHLTAGNFRDRDAAWSPDGTTIAFLSNRDGNYQLWQVRPDGSELQPLVVYESEAFSPVWSPSGERMAWFTRGFRPMASIPTTGVVEELPLPVGNGFRPTSWSPDGTRLAGTLRNAEGERISWAILDLASGQYHAAETPCLSPVWMPDGQCVLCIVGRQITIVEPFAGTTTVVRRLPHPADIDFDISPDGTWVAAVLLENLPEIWIATPR